MKKSSLIPFLLSAILLFGSGVGLVSAILSSPKPAGDLRHDDPFDQPYGVTILDDHQVQLSSKSDTIILLLENSGTLADEYVVFINKK